MPSNGGTELCNGEDEDCDGRIDETFDFDEDPDNCGGCGEICDAEGGAASCVGGRCIVQGCDPGFVDLDRDPANGCECPLQNGGVELCNGEDDDCNGVVDDPGTVRVPVDFRCLERGVCVGVRPVCRDAAWSCDYPAATYEADETRCDDLDNDCDGRLDEAQPEKGDPCFDGMGACQVEGTLVCTDDLAGTECDAVARMATGETCNGIDDDCDGNEDEGVVGTLVTVPADGPRAAFQIMAYEASRPDAAADDAGRNLDRACSNGGVLPWAAVGFDDAQAACRASGMELCTREEWRAACAGAAGQTYPYGDAYEADTCNGRDAGNGAAIPGGAAAECRRDFGGEPVYDLSGNWVSGLPPVDPGDPAPPADARVIRGGGYGNVDGGLTCDFEFFSRDVSQRDNLGFRCCRPVE
ncbi:MAG: MopE-related protein [Planctomycetota bacterium]